MTGEDDDWRGLAYPEFAADSLSKLLGSRILDTCVASHPDLDAWLSTEVTRAQGLAEWILGIATHCIERALYELDTIPLSNRNLVTFLQLPLATPRDKAVIVETLPEWSAEQPSPAASDSARDMTETHTS